MSLEIIDPDGDTIIILKNANAPFAPWSQREHYPNIMLHGDTASEAEAIPCSQSEEPAPEEAEPDIVEAIPESHGKDLDTENSKFRLRVSSKHLTFASTYFTNMFTGPWKESQKDHASTFTVLAEDWDQDALEILMNVIHGRNRSIPQELSLELLAKVSLLTDYYQCHEAVEIVHRQWVAGLKEPVSWNYGRDLILRLFVCWVFGEKKVFNRLIEVALDEAFGPFHTLGLPFPEDLLTDFDVKRERRIHRRLNRIYETLENLCRDRYGCSADCGSMLLGTLAKHMYKNNLKLVRPSTSIGLQCITLDRFRADLIGLNLTPNCSRSALIINQLRKNLVVPPGCERHLDREGCPAEAKGKLGEPGSTAREAKIQLLKELGRCPECRGNLQSFWDRQCDLATILNTERQSTENMYLKNKNKSWGRFHS